jgi:hypothetical protein
MGRTARGGVQTWPSAAALESQEENDQYGPVPFVPVQRDVMEQIKAGDPTWSNHVPAKAAEVIRRRGFFGHRRGAPGKQTPSLPSGISVLDQSAVDFSPAAM